MESILTVRSATLHYGYIWAFAAEGLRVSHWIPSQKELAVLNAGGVVELHFMDEHPRVHVSVSRP